MLLKYSENAAFHLKDRRWLRRYCALCSQWIACASKVKQHYRLSHQQDHERYMLPASRLCSKFNTPGSPCEHCGATIQASRQHPAKCTVLWQISLMYLKRLTGMALEQLQEVFGPLVTEQLNSMEWAPTKREAEPSSAPSDRSKASRTEQGKGRPWQPAPTNKPHWRKGERDAIQMAPI